MTRLAYSSLVRTHGWSGAKPASDEEPIKIGTAVVCSSRPESMGIRFMEMVTDDKNRLSQVILSLLVGQSLHQNLFT